MWFWVCKKQNKIKLLLIVYHTRRFEYEVKMLSRWRLFSLRLVWFVGLYECKCVWGKPYRTVDYAHAEKAVL